MKKQHSLYNLIKDFPSCPGVYLMKDGNDKIIYVGKAKNLPKRLTSYFRNTDNLSPKTARLVDKVEKVDFITTINEIEALILEQNLIKKHSPKYNISLKDDKRFPYIKITKEAFPRVIITRKVQKDKAFYYGPYTEVKELRKILKTMRGIFQYRACDLELSETGPFYQPCFHYQTKRCPAPCAGHVTSKKYHENISLITDFLNGRTRKLLKIMTEKMDQAAAGEKFEEAAKWRDMMEMVKKVSEKQRVSAEMDVNKDIIASYYSGDKACVAVFEIKNGKLLGKKRFFFNQLDLFQTKETMNDFMKQYYFNKTDLPHQIIINEDFNEKELIEKWLEEKGGKKIKVITQPASNNLHLARLVQQNAKYYLEDHLSNLSKKEGAIHQTITALQKNLNLPSPPLHIEGFDISHFQGDQTIASCVYFKNGKPAKKEYRKFLIKTVNQVDDFKSMGEVVERRYTRALKENHKLPDLILIDGGKGQLMAAKTVLDELNLNHIPVIGLAKKFEEIFFPHRKEPIILPKTSAALHLLQAVRDESHRFAITAHRKKREKEFSRSILDQIPGIGHKRKMVLLQKFASINEIADSDMETLKAKTHFPNNIVERIYQFFHFDEFAIVREKFGLYKKET